METADWIWMPYAVVSEVGRGMRVLDWVKISQEEGEVSSFFLVHWFEWRFCMSVS